MMMQRLCSKLRSLAVHSAHFLPSRSSSRRLLHSSAQLHQPLHFHSTTWSFKPLFEASSLLHPSLGISTIRYSPISPLSVSWCKNSFFLIFFWIFLLPSWLLRKCVRKIGILNFETFIYNWIIWIVFKRIFLFICMFKDCSSAACFVEGPAKEEKTDDACHFQAQENQNEILLVGSCFSLCFYFVSFSYWVKMLKKNRNWFEISLIRSYKSRFRTMNDGNIRRWKEGKRHNAHLKVFKFSYQTLFLVWFKIEQYWD